MTTAFFRLVLMIGTVAAVVAALPSVTLSSGAKKAIAVGVGQEFEVKLPGNPTTGFSWKETKVPKGLSKESSTYVPAPHAPGIVGSGGTFQFRFKALEEGTEQIDFEHKRPWENDVAESATVTVNVGATAVQIDAAGSAAQR
eukprot:GDKH01000462.1.p1 GENE.GDKH01000462.1~~GDKH01000462.1.p1  ORF type:complete len:142 (+),score=35.63 GDKH01000462.1:179-604(+)